MPFFVPLTVPLSSSDSILLHNPLFFNNHLRIRAVSFPVTPYLLLHPLFFISSSTHPPLTPSFTFPSLHPPSILLTYQHSSFSFLLQPSSHLPRQISSHNRSRTEPLSVRASFGERRAEQTRRKKDSRGTTKSPIDRKIRAAVRVKYFDEYESDGRVIRDEIYLTSWITPRAR